MPGLRTITRLLDRGAWKPSSSSRLSLFAYLDGDEALAIKADARARAALEDLLRKCRAEPRPIVSLLMLVRSDGLIDRFIEVSFDRFGRIVWTGIRQE